MKKLVLSLFILAFYSTLKSQSQVITYKDAEGIEHKLKQYYVVFLIRGENRAHDKDQAELIQNQHIEYLTGLWKQGIIVLNGPFGDDTDKRGMSIYNVESLDIAKELAENDPAVKAGRLKIEIHPWWSAPFKVEFEE